MAGHSNFDERRRRQRQAGWALLVAVPILLLIAIISFGVAWPVALGISIIACLIALTRWRLKFGSWPWDTVR